MTSETAAAPLLDLDHVDLLTLLQALSDPVRLEIVRQLAACPCPGELACGQIELPVSKSTVTHHMRVLADAGVVAEREAGHPQVHGAPARGARRALPRRARRRDPLGRRAARGRGRVADTLPPP